MAKKVLSIVIGAEITKVCEVSYKKNYKKRKIHVYKSISFPTPSNTIEDGLIKDKIAFSEQLRSELKKAKIRTKKVIFSISSSKIANREVIIPLVNESRISDIIKIGAGDYFPMDIKDYILSYIILEKRTSDRKDKAFQKKQEKLEKKLSKQTALEEKNNKDKSESMEKQKKTPTYKLVFNEDSQTPAPVPEADLRTKKKEDRDKKHQKHIRLSVYAVPSNLVKNYYNFATVMGLEIVSIDYSGNSSYQMLKRQANEGTNVFIQLNEQDTIISILHENVLILQRTLGYGISTLVETLMEQSYYNVNNEKEVMELLQSKNLLILETKPTVKENLSPIQEAAAAMEAEAAANALNSRQEEEIARKHILESLQFLTNSIARMLDYYKNNHKTVLFQSIYLSGFGIRIQGIDQLFTREIGIPNKKLEKLTTVNAKKSAQAYRLYPSEYMPCVGAVLKPVDFVPAELTERKQRVHNIVIVILLVTISLGAAGYLSYTSYMNYLESKKAYDTVAEQLAAMPSTNGVKESNDKANAQLLDLQNMEAQMQNNKEINEVLSELEKKLLTNALIQNIQFSDTGVVMNIVLADNKYGANSLVAKLLLQLKTIEYFSDVQDSNMSVAEDGQISLTVSCTYK